MFTGPDQKDDKDCKHNGSQSYNKEWKVGHDTDDEQQLVHSLRRRVINLHALFKETMEAWYIITVHLSMMSDGLQMCVSHLIEEHDRKHCFIQVFSIPVRGTMDRL